MVDLDRKNKILQIVVQQYIKTGKPVGSKYIAEKYDLSCSPATIRNDLAELEEQGFLTHPHTSAGRLPTDIGYRNYVDTLLNIQKLTQEEQTRIHSEYDLKLKELEEVMKQTSKLLAYVSNFAGFVITSNIDEAILQHIELIRLDTHRILMIIVARNGLVKHKIIHTDIALDNAQVRKLSLLFSNTMKGKKISEILQTVYHEIERECKRQKEILEVTEKIKDQIISIFHEKLIFLEGASNIIEQDDDDIQNMKQIYRIIEEKNMLSKILSENDKKEGIRIRIGNENLCQEMHNCSLITSTYKSNDNVVGVLGIIGPRRMEYPRMIAVVDYISQILNTVINKNEENSSEKKRKIRK